MFIHYVYWWYNSKSVQKHVLTEKNISEMICLCAEWDTNQSFLEYKIINGKNWPVYNQV